MESQGPSLKIYKSSAGSGKTYQLVLNYLSLILKSKKPDKFKRILAITFTNKAAHEMKERVLQGLKKLISGEDKDFVSNYEESTGLPAHELAERSENLLSNILHNYGHLNILTIDKFVHKIIRSFSRELGLTTNFELTFDFDTITARCVDEVLQELGNDQELTKVLVEYYKQLIDQEDNPNIEKALIDRAKVLNTEESADKLAFYRDKDLSFFVEVRTDIRSKIKELRASALKIKTNLENLVGPEITNLKSGRIKAFNSVLKDWENGSIPEPFNDKQLEKVKEADWLSKTKAKQLPELVSILNSHSNQIQRDFLEINDLIIKITFLKNLDKNLMSFALLNDVQQQLQNFKEDNNIIFIGELNRIISDIIGQESAPYIYEKIGTRFENYFVDEFQDTSELQWKNLVPLIHDSLSSGHENLIVGDAKQSIYRWRGGNAQQFIDLPVVNFEMADIQDINRSFSDHHIGDVLRDNYRSSNAVIEFNNWFFPKITEELNIPLISRIYSDSHQNLQRSTKGLVEVVVLKKNSDYNNETPYAAELIRQINDCIEDGYSLSNICILARANKDGSELAKFLKKNGFPVTSQDSLILSESDEIKLIHAFLKVLYRDTEENILRLFSTFKKKSLIFLFDSYRIPAKKNEFYNSGYDLNSFLKDEVPEFELSLFRKLSIYDQIDYLVRILGLSREDLYIDKLMNSAYEFQHRFGHQTGRFIEYMEDKIMSSSVVPSDQNEAITIMTIHKSKGLQFPVVIIPKKIDNKKDSSLWLNGDTLSELGLSEVNMNPGQNAPDSQVQNIRDEHDEFWSVDLMNLIYVAYTRAQDRMYIHLLEQGSSDYIKKQMALVENHTVYDRESTRLVIGIREKNESDRESKKREKLLISTKDTVNWRDSLILATPPNNLVTENASLNEKNWGIAIHTILQHIDDLSNPGPVIDKFLTQNKEWSGRKELITSTIEQFCSNEEISEIYSKTIREFSERSLGANGGITLRPDKVMIKKDKVVVIDFKTGASLAKHKQQLLTYGEVLSSIYTKPIKLYLIYLSTEKITVLNV